MNRYHRGVLAALVAVVTWTALPAYAVIFEVEARCKADWQVDVVLTEGGTPVGTPSPLTLLCANRKVEGEIDVGAAIVNDANVTATRAGGATTCTFVVPPGDPLESIETKCQVEAESDGSEFEESIKISIELQDADDDEEDDD